MRKLRALIFDVDGTLAETEEVHRAAFNAAFAAAGLHWHWDTELYGALLKVTGGKERIRHFVDAYGPPGGGGIDDTAIADLHADKTRRYGAIVTGGEVALRPGVADLIAAARGACITLAIATTTSPANVDALLGACLGPEAKSWFAAIGTAGQAPVKKPAPDVYDWVLEQLQIAPGCCLAIEDSFNGLVAARAAGLACLVTPSLYTKDDDFNGATQIVPDLAAVDLNQLEDLLPN